MGFCGILTLVLICKHDGSVGRHSHADVLTIDDLVKLKEIAGRDRDRDDIKKLLQIKGHGKQ